MLRFVRLKSNASETAITKMEIDLKAVVRGRITAFRQRLAHNSDRPTLLFLGCSQFYVLLNRAKLLKRHPPSSALPIGARSRRRKTEQPSGQNCEIPTHFLMCPASQCPLSFRVGFAIHVCNACATIPDWRAAPGQQLTVGATWTLFRDITTVTASWSITAKSLVSVSKAYFR